MKLYRITREPYVALDGEGARLYGGRWNSPGHPVIYTARTLSLAALELLVHVDPDLIPEDLVAFEIVVPDDIEPRPVDRLPSPLTVDACRAVGDAWIEQSSSLLLSVPSIIIPEEQNLLINPRAEGADRLGIGARRPFRFDERLFNR